MNTKQLLWASTATILITGCASSPVARKTASSQTAVTVQDSGSTNSPSWAIVVSEDGSALLQVLGQSKSYELEGAFASKLFGDVQAAARLAPPEDQGCLKSASFGTTEKMSWQNWSSPDLTCPVPPGPFSELKADLTQLMKAVPVNKVISDIKYPPHLNPANLPHCSTPDGRYEITVNPVVDRVHFFAMVTANSIDPKTDQTPFDSYGITGASPFTGKGNGRGDTDATFNLTLANASYEKDTDASLHAIFVDQNQSDPSTGDRIEPVPLTLSYDHLNCTRWYR